jgi:hypothetical protein
MERIGMYTHKKNGFGQNDAGVFIGLTSSPIGNEHKFCNTFLSDLFMNYKEKIKENHKNISCKGSLLYKREFDKSFYDPRFYFLFGHFDLAAISLIDDFEFAVRSFTPFDPLFYHSEHEHDFSEYFASQVIVGPSPRFSKSVVNASEDTFLRRIQRFPLIGICQLKLNNGFLIGLGIDYYNAVIRYVKHIFENKYPVNSSDGAKIRHIILGSYSWNEITLIVFSDSYRKIGDHVISIRESTYGDLMSFLEEKKRSEQYLKENRNSFIGKLSESNNKNKNDNHLFETTLTTFGFDINLLKNGDGKESGESSGEMMQIDTHDTLMGVTRFFTKAGHADDAKRGLEKILREGKANTKYKTYLCAGKGNLLYPFYDKPIPTRKFIDNFVQLRNSKLREHIFASNTNVSINYCKSPRVGRTHQYVHNYLKDLSYQIEEVREINKTFLANGIPKTLSFRLLNVLTGYNQGILDPVLYQSFIELKPFVQFLCEQFKAAKIVTGLPEKCNELNKIVDSFENAYHNRLYLSEMLTEVSDFNFDFKGGIQQLLSAFDGSYKIISSLFGNPKVFCYVGGDTGIFSTRNYLALDYIHIFQPEIFACVAARETAASFVLKDENFLEEIQIIKTAFGRGKVNDLFRKNEKYKSIFLAMKKSQYLDHIKSDIYSYVVTFMGNAKLFVFWYTHYFLILQKSYEEMNKIDESEFIGMLARILTVLHICDKKEFKKLKSFLDEEYSDSDLYKNLGTLESHWLEPLKIVVSQTWNEKPFHRFGQKLHEDAHKKIPVPRPIDRKSIVNEITNSIRNHGESYTYQMYLAGIQSPEKDEDADSIRYIQFTFYSYLLMIMTECKRGGYPTILERRSADGMHVLSGKEAKILFDPRGGIFICEPKTRREYFKWRTALIMSLWDISMKRKLPLLTSRI